MVKNPLPVQETRVRFLGQEDPLEEEMANQSSILFFFFFPNPVFLPEEFRGQRSLAGYSSWGHKELDTTE